MSEPVEKGAILEDIACGHPDVARLSLDNLTQEGREHWELTVPVDWLPGPEVGGAYVITFRKDEDNCPF